MQLRGKTVLVTGASRGIGAETARVLAGRGAHVLINYRDKRKRAEQVVAGIVGAGGQARALQADLTDADRVRIMLEEIRGHEGGLDGLVLNASGGLERGADPGYALRLNRDAQVQLIEQARPLLRPRSRIVFVTSHEAHFSDRHPVLPEYEPVARSKRAGEDALRARIPELRELGVMLVVVSGDLVEGTITARLLENSRPGITEHRRSRAGALPSVGDFALAVAGALSAPHRSGDTVYVGGADYGIAGVENG